MAEENQTQQVDPNAKGLPPGVTVADTGDAQRGAGAPTPMEINNTAPKTDAGIQQDATQQQATQQETTPEVKPEETPAVDADADYVSYGDPVADAAVALMREAKVSIQEATDIFAEAAKTGDFSKVKMESLEAKLGKEKARLVVAAAEQFYTKQAANTREIATAVYGIAGGEDNYKRVQSWAREKAKVDPAFNAMCAKEINPMFEMGAKAASLAAQELIRLYESDKNNSSLVKAQVNGDAAASLKDTGATLTREQYHAQVKEAYAKCDYALVNSLRARRKASR